MLAEQICSSFMQINFNTLLFSVQRTEYLQSVGICLKSAFQHWSKCPISDGYIFNTTVLRP